MKSIDKSLLEQMHIGDVEIERRKEMLRLDNADLAHLISLHPLIDRHIDTIMEELYQQQTQIEEISQLIGDSETLQRLRLSQRQYVLDLFIGPYDADYVNRRLRIGLIHKRVGVEPRLYLSTMCALKEILFRFLDENPATTETELQTLRFKSILDRLLHFDITLVFDTYIDAMLNEAHIAHHRTRQYARSLEKKTQELAAYAEKDSLTGLYNQRGMATALRREILLAERRKSRLSVLYCDIDDFKKINDSYGHHKGDEILVAVAKLLHECTRQSDICCRAGGDEFCCILPDCGERGARMMSNRVESAFSGHYPTFTISTGIAEFNGQNSITPGDLVRAADEMMYYNKQQRKRLSHSTVISETSEAEADATANSSDLLGNEDIQNPADDANPAPDQTSPWPS